LSKITVDESFELGKGPFFHDSNATIKLLDQLCNQNPRLEVEYLVPAWCIDVAGDDNDWLSSILMGVCHFYGIRGDFKTHIFSPEVQDIVAMHVTNKPPYRLLRMAFPEPLTPTNLRFKPEVWSPDGQLPLALPRDVRKILANNYLVPELAWAQLRRWAMYGF
jgi:hypothetical protein